MPRLIFVACVSLSLAAGIAVGRWSLPSTSRATPPPVPAPPLAAHGSPPRFVPSDQSAPAPSDWTPESWQRLNAQPPTPARTAALSALLERLAEHAPAEALALAQAESNLLLRPRLLEATLRGWGRNAPAEALRWALSANTEFRETALTAAFAGAVAGDPDAAVRAGQALLQDPAADVAGAGNRLIDALCAAGHFTTATAFAASGSPAQRDGWYAAAFSQWAAYQPDAAASAASAVADAAQRSQALHGVIGGWSDAAPAAAVQFATSLPADESEKPSLISQALLRWSKVDLKSASDWINSHELGAAMDQGVSSIASQDYVKPDVAVSWAESVVDPKLRSETVTNVLRRWATTDLPAVKRYLESATTLQPDDRHEIEGVIATLSGTSS